MLIYQYLWNKRVQSLTLYNIDWQYNYYVVLIKFLQSIDCGELVP